MTLEFERANDGTLIQSVAKATAMVECLAAAGPMSLSDLARTLDLTPPGAHRTLATLISVGWVAQLPDRRYALATHLWEIGVASLAQLHPNFLEMASRAIQRIAAELKVHVQVAVPIDGDVVYLGFVSCAEPHTTYRPVAMRRRPYHSSSGKVMLAFQDEEWLEAVCAGPLEALTPDTITSPEVLREQVREARRTGVAFNRGEADPETYGMAVPLLNASGTAAGALAIGGPAAAFTEQFMNRALTVLREHASNLSLALGYSGTLFRQGGPA